MAIRSTIYAFQFQNRFYRVCVERGNLVSDKDFHDVLLTADFCINLETREILKSRVLQDVKSVSESNPLYHMLNDFKLITIDYMLFIENDLDNQEAEEAEEA
jgi:hypothetical protein